MKEVLLIMEQKIAKGDDMQTHCARTRSICTSACSDAVRERNMRRGEGSRESREQGLLVLQEQQKQGKQDEGTEWHHLPEAREQSS